MFIQEHQFRQIAVPKRSCQRSLEEYVVASHMGDKKEYEPPYNSRNYKSRFNGSYIYLNNPIYRVGPEGDPSSNSLSSRHFQPKVGYGPGELKPTESALHSLYPTIDSGSVFLTEKPWDNRWNYQRDNIPNETEQNPHRADHFADIIHSELTDYDNHVGKYLHDWDEREIQTRYLPIYDQAGINDAKVPDGVHVAPFYVPPPPVPRIRDQMPPGTHLIETFEDIKKDEKEKKGEKENKDKKKNIENYEGPGNGNMRNSTSGSSSASRSTMNNRMGHYGYPKPNGYATMGSTDGIYYVSPYKECNSKTKSYDNQVFHSGVKTYGERPCPSIENYKYMPPKKKVESSNYKIWFLVITIMILFVIISLGIWKKRKINKR